LDFGLWTLVVESLRPKTKDPRPKTKDPSPL
jgi:hypothetical protein